MRSTRTLLLAVAALPLISATANARISHGISGLLVIDTVTVVGDDSGALPRAMTLAAVYADPFNPRTVIEFELAEAGPAELAIYDVGGRRIRVMESGPRAAGRYQTAWDGRGDSDRAVPTGTYFCRLSTRQGSETRKLMLAR